jgi:hypothetical protein
MKIQDSVRNIKFTDSLMSHNVLTRILNFRYQDSVVKKN